MKVAGFCSDVYNLIAEYALPKFEMVVYKPVKIYSNSYNFYMFPALMNVLMGDGRAIIRYSL
jgi:hypothetical protein